MGRNVHFNTLQTYRKNSNSNAQREVVAEEKNYSSTFVYRPHSVDDPVKLALICIGNEPDGYEVDALSYLIEQDFEPGSYKSVSRETTQING